MQENRNKWIFGGAILFFGVCCICVFAVLGGASVLRIYSTSRLYTAVVTEVVAPVASLVPTRQEQTVLPTATLQQHEQSRPDNSILPSPTSPSPSLAFSETFDTLSNSFVPASDYLDLAARLNGKVGVPSTVNPPVVPYQVGDRRNFWTSNVDTHENALIEAQLEFISDHVYFWIERGVQFDPKDVEKLVGFFESDIYPTNHEFFGSEWSPGVDLDPRLYILYARNLGINLAGYFSSMDEYHPLVHEYSNAVELFLLNADNLKLDEPFTTGVLAHEFQHMIHWNQDRNEDSWINEGFSELAAFLNGFYESRFDRAFLRDPDLQLNDWPNDPTQTTPHYGAGFLFLTYFYERFGEQTTKMIVSNPENGLTSIDQTLASIGAKDPITGKPITTDDVFIDWVLTNFIQEDAVGDGRFNYRLYKEAQAPSETEIFNTCPVDNQKMTVSQYGADYIAFRCSGEYSLNFQGASEVSVLPEGPYSGKYAYWSNKGDESDMTLTRTFDFRDQDGPITLTYRTWYDLEKDYDYLYLAASTDGISWDILTTPSGTGEDPTGNSFGWAYNGVSGGKQEPEWIYEAVDVTQYAGQVVQFRFEYVTDAAVNGEGFLLDDVSVPEIGYTADFELDNGGWEGQGWVRIQNSLPQSFRLALIYEGDQTEVEYIDVPEDGSVKIPVRIGEGVDQVVFVVTGTTRFTRQVAAYSFELIP